MVSLPGRSPFCRTTMLCFSPSLRVHHQPGACQCCACFLEENRLSRPFLEMQQAQKFMHACIACQGCIALAETDRHDGDMQNTQLMLYEAMRHIKLRP